jgi:hypothetical protein
METSFDDVLRRVRLDVIDDLIRRSEVQPHEAPCPLARVPASAKPLHVECSCYRGHMLDMLKAARQDAARDPNPAAPRPPQPH